MLAAPGDNIGGYGRGIVDLSGLLLPKCKELAGGSESAP